MGLFGKRDREDNGTDNVGDNPTGRPRKSSAGKRRQHDRKTFGGTSYERDDKKGQK